MPSSSQRAYRDRQQKRLKDMQDTIEYLTSDRDKLEAQVRELESDLNRLQTETTIQQIQLQRRNTLPPISRPPDQIKSRPGIERNDGTGWMLKHMYGLGEAEDNVFAVFEVKRRQ